MIVVDEQGNEYEATYPKRAKGLVKNGRARFVAENKICLACPPENVEVNMNNITAKEVFDQIVITQKQLEDLKGPIFNVQCVPVSAEFVTEVDSEYCGEQLEYSEQVATEKLLTIKELICTREQTLRTLLDFYIKVYENCNPKEADNKK